MPPLSAGPKIVGMGSCTIDYLASVAAFPRPDDKLRTETLEVSMYLAVVHARDLRSRVLA